MTKNSTPQETAVAIVEELPDVTIGSGHHIAAAIITATMIQRGESTPLKEMYREAFKAVLAAEQPAVIVPTPPPLPAPAVSIKKSITPDYIVCLEDGKKLKLLKRHLMSTYGMTPKQYRERWGLPADYPMVAPNYAEHRATLARNAGLGRKITASPAQPETKADSKADAKETKAEPKADTKETKAEPKKTTSRAKKADA